MAPFGAPAAALVKRSEECFANPGELSKLWTGSPRLCTWLPINSTPRTGRSACRLISRGSRVTGDETGPAGTAPCFASGSSRETSPPISRFLQLQMSSTFSIIIEKVSWISFETRLPCNSGASRASAARPLALPPGLLLRLPLLQVVLQPVEACLPEPAIMREPVGGMAHRGGVEPARAPLRLAPARDQAGALEHLEVLGDAGKAHVEGFGEFGHRGLAKRKPRQDGAPGRIGERRERARKAIRRHGIEPIS